MGKRQYWFKIIPRWVFTIFVFSFTPAILNLISSLNWDDISLREIIYLIVVLIFFSLGVYISWNKQFIFFNELFDDELKEKAKRKKREVGIFTYTDIGFYYEGELFFWNDITSIIGAGGGESLIIVILLRFKDSRRLMVNEDTPGFYLFMEKMHSEISNFSNDWAGESLIAAANNEAVELLKK